MTKTCCAARVSWLVMGAVLAMLTTGPAAAQDARSKFDIVPDNAGVVGVLRFCESADWLTAPNNTACNGFKAAATITTPVIWQLPAADGTAAQLLKTDGAGVLSWVDDNASATTPAGVDRDLQINSGGVFGIGYTAPSRAFLANTATGDAIVELTTVRDAAYALAGMNCNIYSGANVPGGCRILGFAARGTPGSEGSLLNNDILFRFNSGGWGGTGTKFNKGMFEVKAAGNWSDTSTPTRMEFLVTPAGSTTIASVWRIESTGTLLPLVSDGARDIGSAAQSVGNTFSHLVNTKTLQLENGAETARHTLSIDGSNDFIHTNTSAADIFKISNAGAVTLYGSVLASANETFDMGQAGASFRFRDSYWRTVNAKGLEVTNAAKTSNWQFLQDPATSNELDLKQPSAAIVATFKTSAVEFFQDVIIGNNGSSDVKDLMMRGNVRGLRPVIQMEWATDNVVFQSPGPLAILASYHTTPAAVGALELQTTSAGNGVFRPSSAGGVALTNYFLGDLNIPFQESYQMQVTARHIAGGAPLVRWDDQAGSATRWANIVGPPASGSSWTVELPNSGPGGSGSVLADSGVNGSFGDRLQWLSVTKPPYDVIPATHNTYKQGSATFVWAEGYIRSLTLGKASATRLQGALTVANTAASTTYVLRGVQKDGVGAVESVGSFVIEASSNFYARVFTGGDVNCSGIDDGWDGIRTDTNERQNCDGGATFVTPYISNSFTPRTLNCAAGQVILDPRWENGILVEGSCGAN